MSRSNAPASPQSIPQPPAAPARHPAATSEDLVRAKVEALQLAVNVVQDLTRKIGEGTTAAVRKPRAKEGQPWLRRIGSLGFKKG